jgi:hypothetical protein
VRVSPPENAGEPMTAQTPATSRPAMAVDAKAFLQRDING